MKWLAAAAAAVPLVALPAVGGAVHAASAADFDYFVPGPARVLTLSLLPGGNNDDLRGVVCEPPRTCETLSYSYLFRPLAVATMDAALRDGTTGMQYVFAYSQGARVVSLWLEQRSGLEGAPLPDELGFVLIGNPGRKYGGADSERSNSMPETDYFVLDVSRQYDPASDAPDNPWNLLAMLNANAGLLFIHQDYENVDIYDPANYVWTEGNTTYVFVPTENLPLLQPLRWLGLSALADSLNGPLKEIIERAYDRSYLPAQPGLPPGEPDPEPEEPADPEPEEPADPEPEEPADPLPEEPAETLVPEAAARMASSPTSDGLDVATPVEADGKPESPDVEEDSGHPGVDDEDGIDDEDGTDGDAGEDAETDEGDEPETTDEAESESGEAEGSKSSVRTSQSSSQNDSSSDRGGSADSDE